jgi:transcriptional regulator with XRE-family HTH domain
MTDYTDPPGGIPEDERMSPAELLVIREFLGLSRDALAALLDVPSGSITKWESGDTSVPDGARLAVERIEAATATTVSAGINAAMDAPGPTLVIYRTDEEYRSAHPDTVYPAAWHRAVVARIAQEVVLHASSQQQGQAHGSDHEQAGSTKSRTRRPSR